MNYLELLEHASIQRNSIVCLGMDPLIERIPLSGSPYNKIFTFYENILNKMVQRNVYPGAVKPNYAFYAQYGMEGIKALEKCIKLYKSKGLPVILDVKRGDIGSTAAAYAKEAFEFFAADAVTLVPYMGFDSIQPFINNYPQQGFYILTKTSNKSSVEIQDLISDGMALYEHVAHKIVEWYQPGIGSVVGATFPAQLSRIATIFQQSKKPIPLLIPGIGTQGGDLSQIVMILKESGTMKIHRINSSSAINYAYEKNPGVSYDDAAVNALAKLNDDIGV